MIVVDAANVMGSRPDGWWRNRANAADRLCRELAGAVDAGRLPAPVVVVVEGAARAVSERDEGGISVVHASGSGDDMIVSVATDAVAAGRSVTVVTADRELRERVRREGCEVTGPRWLLDRV